MNKVKNSKDRGYPYFTHTACSPSTPTQFVFHSITMVRVMLSDDRPFILQRCKGERIKFDAGAVRPVPGRQRKFRDPSLLRGGGLSVGPTTLPPGHGATLDTGPDQVTRLTVVLESSADAQLLVRSVA